MLAKWNGKLIAVKKLCWKNICQKNFVRIATQSESHLWNMAKSTRESEFHLCVVFSTRALQTDGGYAKWEFRALQ